MSWQHQRGRVAALTRSRSADDPELLDARRELKTLRLKEKIMADVSAWPPLSDSQKDRLAALLKPAGGGRDAA